MVDIKESWLKTSEMHFGMYLYQGYQERKQYKFIRFTYFVKFKSSVKLWRSLFVNLL